MTVNEIFSAIAAHQIEGMMLHNDMADYYDFLGLRGFKRMHEYHFLCEAMEMRKTHRYYINHYNELPDGAAVSAKGSIPKAWYDYKRQDVDPEAKKNAVQSCVEKWAEWERSTEAMYGEMYEELCDAGEIAAAERVKCLICDVDRELKCADRLHIELAGAGYDLCYVLCMQDALHDKYRAKIEKLGAEQC